MAKTKTTVLSDTESAHFEYLKDNAPETLYRKIYYDSDEPLNQDHFSCLHEENKNDLEDGDVVAVYKLVDYQHVSVRSTRSMKPI